VPVAEYRPNSASLVYRVDPETMEATEGYGLQFYGNCRQLP
jgi:hypothetical protein